MPTVAPIKIRVLREYHTETTPRLVNLVELLRNDTLCYTIYPYQDSLI